MTSSNDQFEVFASNLYEIFKECEQRANDTNAPIEYQLMYGIVANVVIKIAASANAASIKYEGTKQ